jgi:hypothetical protein
MYGVLFAEFFLHLFRLAIPKSNPNSPIELTSTGTYFLTGQNFNFGEKNIFFLLKKSIQQREMGGLS